MRVSKRKPEIEEELILNSLHAGYFFTHLLSSADFFLKNYKAFSNKNLMKTISESNGLDPDQDQRCVGPDIGTNCLQRSSTDDNNRH